jgi:hypothetical protein
LSKAQVAKSSVSGTLVSLTAIIASDNDTGDKFIPNINKHFRFLLQYILKG